MAWTRRRSSNLPPFVVFASISALASRAAKLGLDVPLGAVTAPAEAVENFQRELPVVDIAAPAPVVPGRPDPTNGRSVITAIDRATAAVARGEAAALVTNPIAKHVLYEAGFKHPGHTEYLADLAASHFPGRAWRSVMLLAADELRVVPLTVHVALSRVPGMVTGAVLIETAQILHEALRTDYGFSTPRIAVAGLNPHAGENGSMGTEDRDIIAPAIAELRARGLHVTGPLSADTMFHAAARARYDAAIAMYHDQALIPLKTLAFDRGVNVTLGLPFVRTSPDHGTAFDIAGIGAASPSSFEAAVHEAFRMARRRRSAAPMSGAGQAAS